MSEEVSPRRRQLFWVLLAIAIGLSVQSMWDKEPRPQQTPYSSFLQLIESDQLSSVEIADTQIHATQKSGPKLLVKRIPGQDSDELVELLRAHKVEFTGTRVETPWWQSFLIGLAMPLAFVMLLYWMFSRRLGKAGPMSFGRSAAKIYDRSKDKAVTFDDVAGVDEAKAELREFVDFLQNPTRYASLGAHLPRGALLVGPPGTGKTLLARAVAGEANVPFFSISGSEFVEMFVGVGAARVRSLFEQAKERAPCIVFLDELDAIGKSRGGLGTMATNDEREQTLNQLLIEIDGFEDNAGVIVMAATNRPETLDPALVRAGRFDRQILVSRPDIRGREAILAIHARKVTMLDDSILRDVARRTPGMSGADLANVVNEAALAAARRGGKGVELQDFEEAVDRIQLGLKKAAHIMSRAERARVAFHEGGHALVALSVKHADPVHKVTIVPRGIGALGATLQLPTDDHYLMTREELADQLCVMLAGRSAEKLIYGTESTGASDDLERATETARAMVCRYGMSGLGARSFGNGRQLGFLSGILGGSEDRNYSETTATRIDREIAELLEGQAQRAFDLLSARRSTLTTVAEKLLEQETLTGEALLQLMAAEEGGSKGRSSAQGAHN